MSTLSHTPQLVLLMGVSGSGKTTLGTLLATRLGYTFLDADDYHSSESVNRMRSGIPLTDDIRAAWVERLQTALLEQIYRGCSCVLAFSGLREQHRRQLMQLPFATRAFMLQGNIELLTTRLQQRQGHYMPLSLLQSQLAAMQPVAAEEPIELVSIEPAPEQLVTILAQSLLN